MKRQITFFMLSIVILVVLSGCKITSAVEGQDKSVRVCRNTTKLILSTYQNLKIPDHFRSEHPIKKDGDFEIGSLVKELDFVKINEGFQVDYVYSYRNAMGRPLVYSLPAAKPNFENEDEYKEGKPLSFTYGIESIDQKWGFLQLAILEELGGQFYQYFTAEYDDVLILCDIDDIELLVDRLGSSEVHAPMNWWQKMRAMTISETDPLVTILRSENLVEVSMLQFSNDTGIIRRTYSYSYSFPHVLKEVKDELIVEYKSTPQQTSKK